MSRSVTILLLTFACFATSVSEFAIVGVIDIIAADLGVSISAAGQLLTAFALSGSIGVPLTVMALSRFERRTIMVITLGSTRNLCLAAIVLLAVGVVSTVLATRGGARRPALVPPTAEALEPATI